MTLVPLDDGSTGPGGGLPTVPPHRLVRASAGTGKTYRLTLEILRLLFLGSSPRTILAVTFTRQAAGEILERVLTRLAIACLDEAATEKLSQELHELGVAGVDRAACGELLRRLVADLPRLQISTLDAFFYRLVTCFRYELGLPERPELGTPDDPKSERLRFEALSRVLERGARSDLDELVRLIERLHGEQAKRSVAGALDRVLDALYELYREARSAEAWTRLEVAPPQTDVNLEDALRELKRCLIEEPLEKRVKTALARDYAAAEARDWESFLKDGLAKKVYEGDLQYYRKPLPAVVVAAYRPLLEHARFTLLEVLAGRGMALYGLLRAFDEQYDSLRRRRRLALFGDLSRWLLESLGEVDEAVRMQIAYRLDGRIQHLLLDEFQDTSLEQWRVLKPIAEEIWAHGDGSHSFFCVGDAKQAIYGWRGGCAALFRDIEAELAKREIAPETLDVSYRSSPVILEVVDRVLAAAPQWKPLAPHADLVADWLHGLEAHRAVDREKPGYVEFRVSPSAEPEIDEDSFEGSAGDLASDEPNIHIAAVRAWIEELLGAAPPGYQPAIAVLTRTNRLAGHVLDALRRGGIDASGEGGSPIDDDPAVALVLSALVLADHPGDTASFFHLAHSPLAQPLEITSWDPHRLSAALRRRIGEEGLPRMVSRLATWLARVSSERSRRRLAQLLDLAETFERDDRGRTIDFVAAAERHLVEEPTRSGVRVMTVHRSKGLEFDAVMLCELDWTRRVSSTVWVERKEETAAPTAIFPARNKSIASLDPRLEAARLQEQRRGWQDELSALYVGMTRARYGLYLLAKEGGGDRGAAAWIAEALGRGTPLSRQNVGVPFRAGDPRWMEKLAGSSLSRAQDELAEDSRLRPDDEQVGRSKPASSKTASASERTRRKSPPRSLVTVAPSAGSHQDGTVPATVLLERGSELERMRGSILHAWLAEVEWLDPEKSRGRHSAPSDRQLMSIARREAPEIEGLSLEGWLREFRQMLSHPTVLRVLAPPRKGGARGGELWRERAFALVQDGKLLSGRFDRVFIEHVRGQPAGAVLWDWKGDRVPANRVPELVERYRYQIATYRDALAQILGLLPAAVDARLLFLEIGSEVRVE